MQDNSKKKTGAAMATIAVVAFMAVFIAAFIFLIMGEEQKGANGILILYVGFFAAIIIGVLVSLKQRFREISKGEEDEARKY